MTEVVGRSTEGATSSNVGGGAVRYLAPEFIEDSNAFATTGSDTFSFGMLMLECTTEEAPFSDITSDAAVFDVRIAGVRYPPRPDGPDPESRVPDVLWELMSCCWLAKCKSRPTMEQVHELLSQ